MSRAGEVERRKAEHVRIAAGPGVESRRGAGWDDIQLVHRALPATDLDRIDLSVRFLGRTLPTPFVIAGMTGGFEGAARINALLARAAARHGLAMGVGSQRAALRDPKLEHTYRVVREEAPDTYLIANVGAAQLIPQASGPAFCLGDVRRAVEMIGADALALHLNFLEEVVQPEGDRRAHGIPEALDELSGALAVPLIAKETGAGLSRPTALELGRLGVRALDVGGRGGTSFAAVEASRARSGSDGLRARLGDVFHDWGVPTPVSIAAARAADLPLVASGGVRNGLDAAKAIALGATLVGAARPFLLAALQGEEALDALAGRLVEELRTAVFLSGGRGVADLATAERVVLGETRCWLDQLGYGGSCAG
ncbi:MAG: type 2 isopentenyl-diphosphate Delta-isomerase [Thermoleophilia bacterium]|nr:type 2 isopentenyl-diphosphate Delta-isomerase [Thermoleophilia bacterium]